MTRHDAFEPAVAVDDGIEALRAAQRIDAHRHRGAIDRRIDRQRDDVRFHHFARKQDLERIAAREGSERR